jgi:hypothetical protein
VSNPQLPRRLDRIDGCGYLVLEAIVVAVMGAADGTMNSSPTFLSIAPGPD